MSSLTEPQASVTELHIDLTATDSIFMRLELLPCHYSDCADLSGKAIPK
jgi:hypothetical protein